MFRRTKVCSAALIALGGTLTLVAAPALSQQSLDRVEITGSSIRRIDAEAALPVQVLKREDIQRSGATTVADLLQRLPAIQGSVGESASVGGGGAGVATISLHNIGEQRTLVLLNGHRLAQFGGQSLTGSGAAVDLNVIPLSAIDRVEILTDGASALYGADAIAGVVNFITRSDTSEGDVTMGISNPRGGARETRISATKGFGSLADDGFNVVMSFAHDERTKLDAVQRKFASTAEIKFNDNGKSYRVQQITPSAIPGNAFHDNGTIAADPDDATDPANLDDYTFSPYLVANGRCPDKTFRVTDGADDYCAFNFVGELEIYPVRKRDTVMGSFNKKFGDQQFFFDVLAAKTTNINRIAEVPGSISIPLGSTYHTDYLLPNGVAGDSLAYYRLYDLGKRSGEDSDKFFDIATGLRGTYADWDYNGTYTHSQSKSIQNISGYPGALAVGRLRSSGLLNPFLGPGQQSAAANAAIAKTSFSGYWDGGTSKLDTFSLRGSREIATLPAGPLLLGTGVSHQIEKFQSAPSLFAQGKLADPVAGTLCDPAAPKGDPKQCDQRFGDEAATVPYGANRKATGIFGELIIPAMKSLEFTTSVRYDKYSDFGNATTAKGAFRWTPQPNFLVRGSIGTGYHPPTVPQVSATLQPFGVTSEPYTCTPDLAAVASSLGARCQPGSKQYDQIAGGNKDLKPEKSLQGTLGMRFEPTSQVSLGADLWHVQIKDAFGQLTEDEVFANPLKYKKAWGTKTDTGTGVTYLAFVADNKNLGKEYYTGLDIDALGRSKLDFGELTSQVTLTYMIREAKQLLADGPYYSAIGNHAELGTVTFRWQGRWNNTLKAGDWAHTLGVNFKSGYTDAATDVEVLDAGGNVIGTEAGYRLEVPRYFTLDWQTQWTPRKLLSFTVGILNVMNTNPPLSISGGGLNRGQQFGYDDRYYDSRGRTLYGNVSFKF